MTPRILTVLCALFIGIVLGGCVVAEIAILALPNHVTEATEQ